MVVRLAESFCDSYVITPCHLALAYRTILFFYFFSLLFLSSRGSSHVSRLRDCNLGLSILARPLAARQKRVPHGRPRARSHACLEGLREVVGRRNGRAHLGHGVIAWSRGEARGLGEVEVTGRRQGRGGKASGVGCRRHGQVTVGRRGGGADGLGARVGALAAEVKTQGQGGRRGTHTSAVLLEVEERAGLEVGVVRGCG